MLSAALTVIGPHLIARITGYIEQGLVAGEIDLGGVTRVAFVLIAVYALGGLATYFQQFAMSTAANYLGREMRGELMKKINRLPLCYFDRHNFGDTLSRITNDVDSVAQSLNVSIGNIVNAAAMLVGCLVMMFFTQWVMAFTAIGTTLLGSLLSVILMKCSQRYFNRRQESLAHVNAHVEEYYAGQSVVRLYNAEESARELFDGGNENLRKNTLKAEFMGGLMMPIMTLTGNLGYVAVCIVGAALAFGGAVGFDAIVAFMLYIRLFTSPLGQLANGFSGMQSAVAANRRVREFMEEEELSDESHKKEKLQSVKGDVTFSHVRFGYEEGKTVIGDFSAEIKAGQKVAIVGPTGAGKTTLVGLLMRFYEPNSGRIEVDGVPISSMKREDVHDLFGMVLQDTWLFEGTVRENLTYGKQVSDEKLIEILSLCGLGHFVKTLPQGLDTVLDDNVSISAGQKQLFTIARAMAEDAPMLILDEATSSVDTRTELKIRRAMDELTVGRTSFVIAHRLSTVQGSDVILFLKDGDVKETGTHEELLRKGGLYAELYKSQFARA